MTTLFPKHYIPKVTTKDLGNGSFEHTFHPLSDEQYQLLNQAILPFFEQKSCYEVMQEAIGAAVEGFGPSYNPDPIQLLPASFPIVTIPTGWTQLQIDGFMIQLGDVNTRNSVMIREPHPTEMIYPLQFSTTEGRIMEQQEIGCLKGLKKSGCPALPKLEELGSLRNKRFVFTGSALCSIEDIEHILRHNSVLLNLNFDENHTDKMIYILPFFGVVQLKTRDDTIKFQWNWVMKFGQFDFPCSLPNNETIYL